MNVKKFSASVLCVATVLCLAACSVVRYGNDPDVYGFPSSTEFFGSEEKLPEEYKDAPATVTMCKNEREIAYVAISDAKKDLTGVKFSFGEFSDGVNIFPSDKIEGYKIQYAKISDENGNKNYTEPFGYLPLTDFTNNSCVNSSENQVYAIRFETSAETPAGTYRGTAVLDYDGGRKETEVVVNVLDITLPEKRSFELYFVDRCGDSAWYYADYMGHDEVVSMFRSFAAEQRLPLNIMPDAELAGYSADGLTGQAGRARRFKHLFEQNPNRGIIAIGPWLDYFEGDYSNLDVRSDSLDAFYNAIVEEGIEDYFAFYPIDEPEKNNAERAYALEVLRQFKEYYPKIRCILTASPIEEFYANETSLFVPFFYPDLAEDYADYGDGKPFWVYFLKEHHSSGWYTSMIGASGYLNWEYGLGTTLNDETGAYDVRIAAEDYWNKKSGAFVIPGRVGDGVVNENRLVTTTAAEGIRDASEEYEKLLLFKNSAEALYEDLGITEYTLDELIRSVYTNIIDTKTANTDIIPADIFERVRNELYTDIMNGVTSFTVIAEDRSRTSPNGVKVEVFAEKGADVLLDGKRSDNVVDCGKYEKHVFSDSAVTGLDRHTVTVNGRDSLKTYRMDVYGELTPLVDIQTDFDSLKEALLSNSKTTVPAERIEKVEINGKTAMKITFENTDEEVCLPSGSLPFNNWTGYSDLTFRIEKGEVNSPVYINVALDNGMATAKGSVKAKVYRYDSTCASIDLEEGYFQTVKKKVRRLILSVSNPTSIYITDISLGK